MLKGTLQRNTLLVYFRSASGNPLTQNMNDFRDFLPFFSTVINSKKESIPYNPAVILRHIQVLPQNGGFISQKMCFIMILFHACSMTKDEGNKNLLFCHFWILLVFSLTESLEVLIPLC